MTVGSDYFIPDHGNEIDSNDILDGKTVSEALNFVVSTCYLTAAFFHNPHTFDLPQKLEDTEQKIRAASCELRRLADPESLQKLEEMIV